MLTSLLHGLLSVRGPAAYLIPGALCFGEAAIFLGFVIPGEIAVVYGGVLASQHHVSLPVMLAVVVFAAIAGDTTGYFVGRFFGDWILARRPLKDHRGVEQTRAFLAKRGGPAVFLGRFVSVFRALVPGMAGASDLAFPTFLVYNAAGGLLWGIAYTLVGYFAGKSYQTVLAVVGRATTGVVIGLVVLFVLLVLVRHLRRRKRERADRAQCKAD